MNIFYKSRAFNNIKFGSTQNMSNELALMGIKFDFPKPTALLQYLIGFYTKKDSIILDSFAGSGTTAHAVLNRNKSDGGHRKFILVEIMDYAESITAERVKRVIDGYGQGKSAVKGTGGRGVHPAHCVVPSPAQSQ